MVTSSSFFRSENTLVKNKLPLNNEYVPSWNYLMLLWCSPSKCKQWMPRERRVHLRPAISHFYGLRFIQGGLWFNNTCHDVSKFVPRWKCCSTEEFLSRGMAGIYEYHRTQMFPAHYQKCSLKDEKISLIYSTNRSGLRIYFIIITHPQRD